MEHWIIDRHALATLLNHTLRYLHQIPIDNQPILYQMRDEFTEFIQKYEQKCVKRHRRWHILPEHLIDQIPTYLHDHERLKPLSLIDFDDAWVGDPAYVVTS